MKKLVIRWLVLSLTMIALTSLFSCAKRVAVSQEEKVAEKPSQSSEAPKKVTEPSPPKSLVEPRPLAEEAAPPIPEQVVTPEEKATRTVEEGELPVKAGRTSPGLIPVYFDFDGYNIRPDMVAQLRNNAKWLKNRPDTRIRIEGNTDERGSNEYNLALGQRRAHSAREYLTNLGIAPDRMEILSYGEERPLAPGHNEEAWGVNRRDDFVVIRKDAKPSK